MYLLKSTRTLVKDSCIRSQVYYLINRSYSNDITNNTDKEVRNRSKYDCVVIGLGAMGSSTLYHLAKKNMNVLGLEQFKIPHSYGSSHGLTRITRLAYFENPAYVNLLKRSFTLWDELEKESNEKVFTRTGSLDIGTKDSKTFLGSKLSCEQHKLEHTVLNPEQFRERFKGWESIPAEDALCAIYQPTGGVLNPEKCIKAHIKVAKEYGAQVNEEEPVTDISIYNENEVLIKTNRNEYLTSKIVLSSGAWLGHLIDSCPSLSSIERLRKISGLLKPERNIVIWYQSSKPDYYRPHNFPVFNMAYKGEQYYGFPIIDSNEFEYEKYGFKIGKWHHRKQSLSYSMLNKNAKWRQEFDNEDRKVLEDITRRLLPNAYGPILHQLACLFTNTPDENFIIDPVLSHKCVALVSACSGHGFKFSSVIGEVMAKGIINQSQKSYRYPYGDVDWLKSDRF